MLEELDYFAQALDHGLFVTNGTSHSTSKAIAQSMVDVEFARRAWS
jgi:hypothetical protein